MKSKIQYGSVPICLLAILSASQDPQQVTALSINSLNHEQIWELAHEQGILDRARK